MGRLLCLLLVQTQLAWWQLTSFGPPEGSQGWPPLDVLQSRSDRARVPRLSRGGANHASHTGFEPVVWSDF